MSTQKDIIGIVKELQAMRAYGIEHVHDDTRVSARNVPEVEWLYWHRLEKEFPNIAQALIIAVEALEAVSQSYKEEIAGNLKKILPTHEAIFSQKALARIRLLPTQ